LCSTLTNYLHDFYVQSFITAKYWGKGPRSWDFATVSAFIRGTLHDDVVATPSSELNSTMVTTPRTPHGRQANIELPTQKCRWVIHTSPHWYEPIPEQVAEDPEEFDIRDPGSWPQWSTGEQSTPNFPETLQQSVHESNFSPISSEEVALSTQDIKQALQTSPGVLEVDAWKMAIISGNSELISDLYENNFCTPVGIDEIYPLHLAATFIDGGNVCCQMIYELTSILGSTYAFGRNLDKLGHTILDKLMVSILRSHTSVSPESVCEYFDPPSRYPGAEKDICGRWDRESPIVNQLFRQGYSQIPTDWKHAFCHTSAQAVCHAMFGIYGAPGISRINDPSGLFLHRCSNCGLQLPLGPLHAAVVVAFYLAYKGMPGETLFGALAMMNCLLRIGANPDISSNISVDAILGVQNESECSHVEMTPRQLMKAVPQNIRQEWSEECETAWACMILVLERAERNFQQSPAPGTSSESSTSDEDMADLSESDDESLSTTCDWMLGEGHETYSIPCTGYELGLLWATIQAELLTYRRIDETDPWLSAKIDMHALKSWLSGESQDFSTPLVQNDMMTWHSICGWFRPDSGEVLPNAEDISKKYFMNMDIYHRATYIDHADFCGAWFD